jgi:nucleoside-diphosphate kinase
MKMVMEQSLVLIKPDGLVKSLTGNIITKLSETELQIVGAKIVQVTRELAEEHYQHLMEAKFFDELIKYIMGHFHTRRVLALVYQGENAIEKIRRIAGETNPENAEPISIRGKYGRITSAGVFENVVHASENASEAEREIKLWFRPDELVYTLYDTELREVTLDRVFWKEEQPEKKKKKKKS